MRKIKQYFTNWDASRYLRLILGIIFGLAFVFDGQIFYLGLSAFFMLQALMNIGCGGVRGGCVVDSNKKTGTEKLKEL